MPLRDVPAHKELIEKLTLREIESVARSHGVTGRELQSNKVVAMAHLFLKASQQVERANSLGRCIGEVAQPSPAKSPKTEADSCAWSEPDGPPPRRLFQANGGQYEVSAAVAAAAHKSTNHRRAFVIVIV